MLLEIVPNLTDGLEGIILVILLNAFFNFIIKLRGSND